MADRLKRTGPAPKVGILHLGPGAFFRAHLAVYTDEAMGAAGGDWGICAVSLQSARARDQLAPQGGVYNAVELGPKGRVPRQVGAIAQVLVAPENPNAVIARLADPAVRIVSLTITEKGYGHDPATGRLDGARAGIAADLAAPDYPKTAIGLLAAGLAARHAAGGGPLSILSCDNLMGNGAVTRAVLCDYAARRDAGLARWIEAECSFPATMVDRITPATTPADLVQLEAQIGLRDEAAVMHEPYRQWVIEDRFAAGRPAWEQAGAEMVSDVAAHERMKLRCLNGAHSALAYLGGLIGHTTIAEAAGDPVLAAFCTRLWREDVVPTVPAPQGSDMASYCAALLARFQNPAIAHRTAQVAMDGSQKLPARIVTPMTEHLAVGRVPGGLILVLAGWLRYIAGKDEAGRPVALSDPLAATLRAVHRHTTDPAEIVNRILALDAIFPPALAADPRLQSALRDAYRAIASRGVRAALRGFISS
ncbi:MAG: mannitol dehydrogenase family protein [Pseudomonadota bacterium]